jgi:hypothetical protein
MMSYVMEYILIIMSVDKGITCFLNFSLRLFQDVCACDLKKLCSLNVPHKNKI